jgi:hypothetical protein
MPFLSFETHGNRREIAAVIRPLAGKPGGWADSSPEADIIQGYFNSKEAPVHCRRTLDQFYYHMLESTDRRDMDQVMFKSAKRFTGEPFPDNESVSARTTENLNDLPVVMVDQLWLWIVDDGKDTQL